MNFILDYQWEIFISLEVLSIISLLLFGIVRYGFWKKKTSLVFIIGFIAFLILEALLSILVYRETGEFSNFQLIILIFVLYACSFGIGDFKRLDRWMRVKIGKWRGEELLTERDYQVIAQEKDPSFIARKYRRSSTIHLIIFVSFQAVFWWLGTASLPEMINYLKDLSWFNSGDYANSPYPNETLYGIGMLWVIIFVVDFIWSWSYTIFPSSSK